MSEATFVRKLQRLFNSEGFLTKKEVDAGYGIADLILVQKAGVDFNRCKVRSNYGQKYPLLKPEYFRVLKHVPDQESQKTPATFDYLTKKTGFSKSYLRSKILKTLERNGYIRRVGERAYLKINGWLPLAREVIAIEAKLKDWKGGFIQANRYKLFADKVYLAIPIGVEHLVNKELLIQYGVGLIVLDEKTNKKRVSILARKNRSVDLSRKNYALELFWNMKGLRALS